MGRIRARSKAMPDQYPHDGPATIPTAYTELTPPAFAVWLRLMVEPREVLKIGRRKLSGLLAYSEKRSNVILRELALKGYISFLPNGPGRPTEVIIVRRALISSRAGFVRLSNLLASLDSDGLDVIGPSVGPTNLVPTYLPTASAGLTHGRGPSYPWYESELPTGGVRKPTGAGDGNPNKRQDTHGCGFTREHVALLSARIRPEPIERRKFVAPGVYASATSPPTREDIRERYKRKQEQQKGRRKAERSEAERRRTTRNKVRGVAPGSIDWLRLDQRGNPSVSFEPSVAERKRIITVLNRKPRDSERKRLVAKIATEFGRIYTRYRRQAERRLGRSFSEYDCNVIDGERKYAADAGIWCIRKLVTPRQVLEYWDENIKHFADGSMALPPLSFLRWPANIDRVACSVLSKGRGKRQGGPTAQAPSHKPNGGNSFSDMDGLDVRLRPALNDAGFATVEYNDRYLLGIQFNALAIASGERIFMGESRAKRMAVWAAENLYAE